MTQPRLQLRLNHQSPLPLHVQAEELLRRLIRQPGYQQGGLLPDEVSLSNTLGVSRNTLRAAIGRLVTEGRLERKAGVGTRVTEPKIKSGIGAWHSFTREMEGKGIKVETYSLSMRQTAASEEVARALKIPSQTKVVCLDRVRGWDGQPEVYFRSYFHPRLKLPKTADFRQPLYELVESHCSVVADQSEEEVTAVAASRQLARLLKVKTGSPLLRRERVVLDTGRKPIEFAVVHYRCDRFKLTLNLRQE